MRAALSALVLLTLITDCLAGEGPSFHREVELVESLLRKGPALNCARVQAGIQLLLAVQSTRNLQPQDASAIAHLQGLLSRFEVLAPGNSSRPLELKRLIQDTEHYISNLSPSQHQQPRLLHISPAFVNPALLGPEDPVIITIIGSFLGVLRPSSRNLDSEGEKEIEYFGPHVEIASSLSSPLSAALRYSADFLNESALSVSLPASALFASTPTGAWAKEVATGAASTGSLISAAFTVRLPWTPTAWWHFGVAQERREDVYEGLRVGLLPALPGKVTLRKWPGQRQRRYREGPRSEQPLCARGKQGTHEEWMDNLNVQHTLSATEGWRLVPGTAQLLPLGDWTSHATWELVEENPSRVVIRVSTICPSAHIAGSSTPEEPPAFHFRIAFYEQSQASAAGSAESNNLQVHDDLSWGQSLFISDSYQAWRMDWDASAFAGLGGARLTTLYGSVCATSSADITVSPPELWRVLRPLVSVRTVERKGGWEVGFAAPKTWDLLAAKEHVTPARHTVEAGLRPAVLLSLLFGAVVLFGLVFKVRKKARRAGYEPLPSADVAGLKQSYGAV